MPYCTRCGREIEQGARCVCQQSDTNWKSIFGVSEEPEEPKSHDPKVVYERGLKIVPENVCADDGEVPIRQYDLCRLRSRIKFMFADGRLQVTNKRILFRAKGKSLTGPTLVQHEFTIADLAGFQILRNYRFSILDLFLILILIGVCGGIAQEINAWCFATKARVFLLILTYLVGLFLLLCSFGFKKKYLKTAIVSGFASGFLTLPCITLISHAAMKGNKFLVVLACIPAIFDIIAGIKVLVTAFLFSFKPNLQFNVCSKMGQGVIEIRCEPNGFGKFVSMINAAFTGYNEVLPTAETDAAISEIGAMLSDIQTLGDLAIDKWKKD